MFKRLVVAKKESGDVFHVIQQQINRVV